MKTTLTLIFALFFGAMAIAQNVQDNDTVETIKMGVILDIGISTTVHVKQMETANPNSVARLHMFKNTRVEKALAFRTKRDRSKLT